MYSWTEKQKKAHARNYAIFLLRGQYGVLQHIEHTALVSTAQACCEIDNILTAMGAETNQARQDKFYEKVVYEPV